MGAAANSFAAIGASLDVTGRSKILRPRKNVASTKPRISVPA
jgi:hypothetical protein